MVPRTTEPSKKNLAAFIQLGPMKTNTVCPTECFVNILMTLPLAIFCKAYCKLLYTLICFPILIKTSIEM